MVKNEYHNGNAEMVNTRSLSIENRNEARTVYVVDVVHEKEDCLWLID